jgi:MFS superfamily sulfate permease-like transporter
VAIVKKEFRLGKLAKFMGTPVLGYVFGFAVLMILASAPNAPSSLAVFVSVAYFFVILALVSSILSHLGRMGLPVPSYLRKE